MRAIAIGLNILLLFALAWVMITEGVWLDDPLEVLIVILVFAAPASSVIVLLYRSHEGWIGLYLRRKAIEEKKKIEKLERSDQ